MSTLLLRGLVAGTCLAAAPAFAQQSYVETFDTTTFRDDAQTTAAWDTSTGTIGLRTAALVGTYDTAGQALDVAVRGGLAVVADRSNVRVLDVSSPASPVELGSVAVPAPGEAQAVEIYGNLALVAAGVAGLLFVDLSNPAAPAVVGGVDTPGFARGLAVNGEYVYIADTSGVVITSTIPGIPGPFLVSPFPGTVLDVDVEGNVGVLALGAAGFQKIGLSLLFPGFSTGPIIDTPGFAQEVEIRGDTLFIADESGGLRIHSGLGAAPLLGSYATSGLAQRFEVYGERVYLEDAGDLLILDVTDVANPTLVERVTDGGGTGGIAVADTHAYAAAGSDGVRVSEVSTFAPSLLSQTSLGTLCIAQRGDILYATSANRIEAVDVSDPVNPQPPVTLFSDTDSLLACDAVGDWLVVGRAQSAFVLTFQITSPTSIAQVASIVVGGGRPRRIEIYGRWAFVSTEGSMLEQVELDPGFSNPVTTVGSYSFLNDFCIDGNRMYVLADQSLLVYDLQFGATPVQIGSFSPVNAGGIAVSGNYAYLGQGVSVAVIDVSNPASMSQVTTFGSGLRITLDGQLAYVRGSGGGASVWDVGNPSAPTFVGNLTGANGLPTLVADGTRLYAADLNLSIYEPLRGYPDTVRNRAQSLSIDGADDVIDEVSLSTVQAAGVTWEVTADGGQSWQGVPADGTWTTLTQPGDDLRWRSTHAVVTPTENPTASDLNVSWRVQEPSTEFCTTEVSCPCGNDGAPNSGCDIPQSTGGVRLDLVEQDAVGSRATLRGTGFPPASTPTSIVIRATTLEAAPVPFGDGVRCVGTPLVRLAATFATGGAATHAFTHGAMAGPGTFYYQVWFRSTPAMFCTPDAFNLSNGRSLTW